MLNMKIINYGFIAILTAPQCPQNMIYHQCGPFCSSTCINNTATCYSGCAEGCFCRDEYLTDDYGKCKKKCPS